MTDQTLAVETAAAALSQPTGLAFLDDERYLIIEKATGLVRLGRIGDDRDPETVLDLAVNSFDERGLLGVAVHPLFETQPFVYLYWTWRGRGDGEQQLLGPDTEDPTALPDLGNRVDRFRWDGTALSWDRVIVEMRSNTLQTDTAGRIRGNHDAGPLAFGRDGKLYVTQGDQNLRGQLQNIADGPPPDDPNLTGVILRLNDDGTVPEDNPLVAAGDALGGAAGENLKMVFAYGIRNTFGLAIHPTTGAVWETENGDDSWDEINVFPAGANSGWIQFIGPSDRLAEYREIEVGTPDGLDNPDYPPDRLASDAAAARAALVGLEGSTYVEPSFAWKYPVAVTAIGFVVDDALGAASQNTAWIGTVLTNSLIRYPMTEDGTAFAFPEGDGLADLVDDNVSKGDLGESKSYVVGTGFGVVTAIVNGPDRALYVVSLTNGALYRIAAA